MRKPGTQPTPTLYSALYLNSHVLEVMSRPVYHIPDPEDGAVQVGFSVVGASFQVGVVWRFKDVGPRSQSSRHEFVSNVRFSGNMETVLFSHWTSWIFEFITVYPVKEQLFSHRRREMETNEDTWSCQLRVAEFYQLLTSALTFQSLC